MITKTKEGKINWGFNFSYSTFDSYKTSQLMFYFNKIANAEPTDTVPQVYSDCGNILHTCCEEYIKDKDANVENMMEDLWEKKGIDNIPSLNGSPLPIGKYKLMLLKAKKIIDEKYRVGEVTPELHLEFQKEEFTGLRIKGYVDVCQKTDDGNIYMADWKSNSSSSYDMHKDQRLCYSWMYWREFGVIPDRCDWYYLQTNEVHSDSFTLPEVEEFENRIKSFIQEILIKGNNVDNYELGDFEFIFNSYKTLCQIELEKRRNKNTIIAKLENNKLYFDNLPEKLIKVMDLKYSYHVENFFRMEKYIKGQWDGKKHMFDVNKKILSYGFFSDFKKLLHDFNKHYNTDYVLRVFDKRSEKIKNKVFNTEFKDNDIELRYYQKDAVDVALLKKQGILNLATSAGKSYIAGEIIKRLNRRTLCVVNKIELARQFKDDLEKYLGVEVGLMTEGELVVNKQITVASVQTIMSILKRNNEESRKLSLYLFNITCVVYDEAQNLKNVGMYKMLADKLVNVTNIYALTGTAYRNYKPETIEMYSLVGHPIYKKSIQELEAEGFVVPVKSYFLPVEYYDDYDDDNKLTAYDYHEEYRLFVVENSSRNESIVEFVRKHRGNNKILVVTKSVEHAKMLGEEIPDSFVIVGATNSKKRKEMFDAFKNSDGFVLVGSLKIFSAGINIPTLDIVVCASGHASTIDTPQLVGRLRRTSEGKKEAYFIDFNDDTKYLSNHTDMRKKYLELYGSKPINVSNIDEVVLDGKM